MTERFELLDRIGRGGMGVVWKARDTESGEIVALKLMHDMFQDDEDFVARFSREVELTRRIDSPNVVRTLGFGQRDGRPFMAMEYVDGLSLRDRIKAKPLTWAELKAIARETALGLGAAHQAGVIHRDIKPSNILLTADGHAKVADFGISTAADLTRLTGSQTMLGSPAYMAPESNRDHRGDLYALGCVLFEALTGRQVFEGESITDIVRAHMSQPPPLELLPGEARPLVAWLLRKNPLDRPADASAFVAALDGDARIPPPLTATPAAAPTRPPRRRAFPAMVAGVAALLTLGVAGATFVAMGGDDDPEPASADGVESATVRPSDTPATGTPTQRISTAIPLLGESPTVLAPGSATAVATAGGIANVVGSLTPTATATSTTTPTRTSTSQPGVVSPTATHTPTPPPPTNTPIPIPPTATSTPLGSLTVQASCGGVIAIVPCSQTLTVGERVVVEVRFTGQGGSGTTFVEVYASITFDRTKLFYLDSYGNGSCGGGFSSSTITCTWNGRVGGDQHEMINSLHFAVTQSGITEVSGTMQATTE